MIGRLAALAGLALLILPAGAGRTFQCARRAEPAADGISIYAPNIDQVSVTISHDRKQWVAGERARHAIICNRRLAQDRFHPVVAFSERVQTRIAVLCLDLDNFKTINDPRSHLIGDRLI